jgi:hypothetical protein
MRPIRYKNAQMRLGSAANADLTDQFRQRGCFIDPDSYEQASNALGLRVYLCGF